MHTKPIFRIFVLITGFILLAADNANAQHRLQYGDPGQPGRYAVGHTGYQMVNRDAGNRPVFVGVWYPVDASSITTSTPPAEYLTDPYTGTTYLPPTFSTDWQNIGYDPAYEGPNPAHGPFPLVMVSPGWGADHWFYIFIATRLASHGYVIAVLEHWADGQWPWSNFDDLVKVMVNRPRDVSFGIKQLLAKSAARGELLFHTIDPSRIAASGHSIGGYATYTLAGGDNLVCDAQFPFLSGSDTLPYPSTTCVPTPRDPRIKAIISLDGSSQMLRYRELANISVPSLILGDTVDQSEVIDANGDLRDWIARPHAAIDRDDSYRVDVNGANHYSWTNYCDAAQVWLNKGWISSDQLTAWLASWPCASTGWFPVTISSAAEHAVTTKYMIAFLDLYFGGPDKNPQLDQWVLTPEYALDHTPTVQFFNSERCHADLPDHTYFTYRAYQLSSECDVAQKDPTGWFAESTKK
jgi:predicted dienelactone hydrolase